MIKEASVLKIMYEDVVYKKSPDKIRAFFYPLNRTIFITLHLVPIAHPRMKDLEVM